MGEETTNQWFYKPAFATGSRSEHASFNDKLDALDAALGAFMQGFRDGCRPEWKSAADIYINTGVIEINKKLIEISSQITVTWSDLDTGSEANSTWYYLYVDTSGNAHISASAPSAGFKSRYHPSQSTWRCIGSFYNNSAGNIRKSYYFDDGYTAWDDPSNFNIANASEPSTTWTDYDCSTWASGIAEKVRIVHAIEYVDVNSYFHTRKNGSTAGTGKYIAFTNASIAIECSPADEPVDSAQIYEGRFSDAGTNKYYATAVVYWEDL